MRREKKHAHNGNTHKKKQHVNIDFENVAVAKGFVDIDLEQIPVA